MKLGKYVTVSVFILAVLRGIVPADGGVVGYWRFEDGGGGTAVDETGRYNGDLTGFYYHDPGIGDTEHAQGWSTNVSAATVPQTGAANTGSIHMGGGGAYVDLSNGQDMFLGTSYTVEMFMRPDMPIIGSSVFGLSGWSGIGLSLTESLGVLYWNMSFNSEMPYTLATGVEIDAWQHVALVKIPGQYSIYINGLLEATGGVGSNGDGPYWFPGTDNSGDRVIGGDSGTFRGWLDEFRISDTALTPDQFLCAIPEPSTLGLMLLGAAGLAWRRRM
ncbi:MAG: PEP-CTERM sorting domain-containing protein [Deltaproteobacteria bacterium]|nr:PEP-CTERM sorting domain-containing protein [Deltaproteobacteria bacterium]